MKFTTTLLILFLTIPLLFSQYNFGLELEADVLIEGRLNLDSGNESVIIGSQAGFTLNTSASENTFIGNFSGLLNTSGRRNTFIGYSSGLSNTTGTQNTYIGRAAGRGVNGGVNTFLGQDTGFAMPFGFRNTFVGYGAGYNHNGGNGNVFIGNEAGRFASGSDLLIIENSQAVQPLIFGNFNTNEVGINWNSTLAIPNTLSVNGTASKSTAGDWLANSDARLKKDIEYLSSEDMLEKVKSMRAVSYTWNDNVTGFERPTETQFGFIAQDIQQVWPENVSEDAQGYLQTAYGTYDHMYVEAIKELAKENDAIKKEIQLLRQQIEYINETLKSTASN